MRAKALSEEHQTEARMLVPEEDGRRGVESPSSRQDAHGD